MDTEKDLIAQLTHTLSLLILKTHMNFKNTITKCANELG